MRAFTPKRGRATLALLLALLPLAACGKKGGPVPPGPANEIVYPRQYPAPE